MSGTLTIDTDNVLDDALREHARTSGKPVPELAREILSRALLDVSKPRPQTRQRQDRSEMRERPLPPLDFREREDAWRRSNRDLLQSQYAGQWVVLEGEDVVAHGENAAQAVGEARAKGIAIPYVFYVETPRPPGVVRIGL